MKRIQYAMYQVKKCRACYNDELIDILSLGNHHLSDFIITDTKPPKFPLDIVLCTHCHLLQLKHTVPQRLLYTDHYGYKSGVNNTIRGDLRDIVKKALQHMKQNKAGLLVVDIGANDGTLLSYYPKLVKKVAIEPIKKYAQECKSYVDFVINDYFNARVYKKELRNKKANIITAISCFYDIDNPNEFLSNITDILDKKGIVIIQQNYLVSMLQQNAFDNIVHEHLEYYSLLSLEQLLKRHNLEVFDVEFNPINGGSFRTYICYKNVKKVKDSVLKLRKKEEMLQLGKKEIYKQFARRVKENKKKLIQLLKEIIRNNKSIYIYGASTRGNTLLQYFNIDNKIIRAAVERNHEKWGKKIASVGIPIISEEQAREEKPNYMLVLPWFFKGEFVEREKSYLASGGHFIFPLPQVEVI